MSGNRRPPQARDRMLGMQLRHYRLERGLTLEEAANAALVSLATMSRTESGLRHITVEDIAALLAIYRVDPKKRATLLANARNDCNATHWVERDPGCTPDVLATCTATSRALTEFSLNAVPPALQTRNYALGYLRACGTTDLDNAWATRFALSKSRELVEQTYFIHESALETPYGGPNALREQLHHLVKPPPAVGIRLVRTDAPLSSLNHSWTVLEYNFAPATVHVELPHGVLFLHEPVTAGYLTDLEQLCRVAYTLEQTRTRLIRRLQANQAAQAVPARGIGT